LLNTTNTQNLFSSSNLKNFKTIFDIHKTNSYTTLQTTLQTYKMPITTDYNVFAQKYHKPFNSAMEGIISHVQNQNTLIKELREENEKLKNENEKIVEMEKFKEDKELYRKRNIEYKKQIEELRECIAFHGYITKEDNEKLKEENEELEEKYYNLVEKVAEDITEFEEEVCNLNRNIRMDKSIIQNLILSLIATQNNDLVWQMKDKYDIAGVDIYEKYKNDMINELVKDMNDNDWNDDNNNLEIVYEDETFEVVCSYFKESEEEEEEEEYVEDINGYKVNMAQIKYMADKFNMSMEQVKEIAKTSDCDYSKE